MLADVHLCESSFNTDISCIGQNADVIAYPFFEHLLGILKKCVSFVPRILSPTAALCTLHFRCPHHIMQTFVATALPSPEIVAASSSPSTPDTRTFIRHDPPSLFVVALLLSSSEVLFASIIASFVSSSTNPSFFRTATASSTVLLLVTVTEPSALCASSTGQLSAVRTLLANSDLHR